MRIFQDQDKHTAYSLSSVIVSLIKQRHGLVYKSIFNDISFKIKEINVSWDWE